MNKIIALLGTLIPSIAFASTPSATWDFTTTGAGIIAVIVFVLAYIFVIAEEQLELKKSVPVITAGGHYMAYHRREAIKCGRHANRSS